MNTIALIIGYASLGCCVSLLGYGVWTTWQTRRRTRRVLRFVMEQVVAADRALVEQQDAELRAAVRFADPYRRHALRHAHGKLTEPRVTLYADSEAEVIAKLLGEQERP